AVSSSSSPAPPCSTGTWRPTTPRRASPCQSAGSCPVALSMIARTRVVGHSASSQRRIVSFRRSCSGERPKSIGSLLPVAREAESALGDDVPLDVGGATGDENAERPHVGAAEHPHRGCGAYPGGEERLVAAHVHRELRDVVPELGRGELHDHAGEPRLLAARAHGEEAVALVLVREQARLELDQTPADHGIRTRGTAADLER